MTSDYDVDGFMDLFVTNGLHLYPEPPNYTSGGPDKLFRNLGNANHWAEFDLRGTVSNRDGIGATVIVTAGGKTQRREANGGYKRWAQNDRRLHFGLGPNSTMNVSVRWPSGTVNNYANVPADRLYEAVEGGAALVPITIGTPPDPPDEVPVTQWINRDGRREHVRQFGLLLGRRRRLERAYRQLRAFVDVRRDR